MLTDVQHGFRNYQSCETQLIKTVNDLAKSINKGQQVDCILLDFSEAFDVICHRKLLLKLHHYGIRGKNLKWIENFLKNRTQLVVVECAISSVVQVISGVPQGSVLGPMLFLVYTNDLPLVVSSTIGLFTDDTYIYRVIKTKEDTTDLQRDLDALVKWEQTWSMKFHSDKCKVLTITSKRKIIRFDYKIHNKFLEKVDHAKYLGVHIDKKTSMEIPCL